MQQAEQVDYTTLLAEMNESLTTQTQHLSYLPDLSVSQELVFNRIELLIFINILLLIVTIYAMARRT